MSNHEKAKEIFDQWFDGILGNREAELRASYFGVLEEYQELKESWKSQYNTKRN